MIRFWNYNSELPVNNRGGAVVDFPSLASPTAAKQTRHAKNKGSAIIQQMGFFDEG